MVSYSHACSRWKSWIFLFFRNFPSVRKSLRIFESFNELQTFLGNFMPAGYRMYRVQRGKSLERIWIYWLIMKGFLWTFKYQTTEFDSRVKVEVATWKSTWIVIFNFLDIKLILTNQNAHSKIFSIFSDHLRSRWIDCERWLETRTWKRSRWWCKYKNSTQNSSLVRLNSRKRRYRCVYVKN